MYKVTTGGLGYYRGTPRGFGDLPGFPGADAQGLLTNIGESIWNVLGNLLYIMGAVPEVDMTDNGRAGRLAIERYFAGLVSTADVAAGNYAKVNSAGNQTALNFLKMFGGQPRTATGVSPGDLQGSCMAYSVGPSQFFAAQTNFSGSWSPQTKCAQLAALLNGSGLNWLQVAAGGDGLGNMPTGSGQSQAEIARSATAAAQAQADAAFSAKQQAQQAAAWSQPAPVVQPVVQTYQPMPVSQPAQQAGYYQPMAAPVPVQAPQPVSNPLTGTAQATSSGPLAMVAPAGSTPQTSQTPQGQRRNRQQQQTQTQQYPASAVQTAPVPAASTAAASSPATSSSSTLGGITDWITANPLIAAGVAAAALFMFSRGGKR